MSTTTTRHPDSRDDAHGPTFIGVDVGGTNIKSVVVEARPGTRPTVLAQDECGTMPGSVEAILHQVASIAAEHATRFPNSAGLGFSLPGAIDRIAGVAGVMPNLPGSWHGVPVRDIVGEASGIPTSAVNDARAFTLAESRLGAGRGLGVVVGVTLGTGLGGGVVINGDLQEGASGFAGELGHQILDAGGLPCGCGNRGCAETFVRAEVLCQAAGEPTVEAAFRSAANGETRASWAVGRYVHYLAVALANVHTLLGPDAFVIGGGIAAAGQQLLGPLRAEIQGMITFDRPQNVHLRRSELGSIAGAIGAALVAEHAAVQPTAALTSDAWRGLISPPS